MPNPKKPRAKYLHLKFAGDLIVDKRGMVYGVRIKSADRLLVNVDLRNKGFSSNTTV